MQYTTSYLDNLRTASPSVYKFPLSSKASTSSHIFRIAIKSIVQPKRGVTLLLYTENIPSNKNARTERNQIQLNFTSSIRTGIFVILPYTTRRAAEKRFSLAEDSKLWKEDAQLKRLSVRIQSHSIIIMLLFIIRSRAR